MKYFTKGLKYKNYFYILFNNDKSMKRILFIFLFLNASIAFSQQVWTQKKGEGYFQVGASSAGYDNVFDNNSESYAIPRAIAQTIISGYGEYGITDKLMATLIVPFHLTSTGDSNSSFSGIAMKVVT